MKEKSMGMIIVAVLVVAVIAVAGYMSLSGGKADANSMAAAKTTINETLTGMNLTYYSIAGLPMNYTIGQDDIKSIEPTTYKGESAWKVRVGEGLAWDLTMDADGKNILYTDQLFRT